MRRSTETPVLSRIRGRTFGGIAQLLAPVTVPTVTRHAQHSVCWASPNQENHVFVLAILLGVVAVIALVATLLAPKFEAKRTLPAVIASVAGVLALLSLVASSYNSVGANEEAVPVTFGHTGAELHSGVHFLSPFTDLITYSTQVQDYRMANSTNEGQTQGADAVPFTGSDNGQLTADVDVNFLVVDATKAYHNIGDQARIEDVFVRGQVRAAVNTEANAFTSDVLMHNIGALGPKTVTDLQGKFEANGLELQSVLVRNPVPGANLQAKLKAQQAAEAAQAQQTQAQIEAKTAVIQAQGQAQAAQVLGQAIERFPNVTCNSFVQGLIDGKITGPVYVAPGCPNSGGGVTPLVQSGTGK